jgi:NADH-quinone oxidoreductase subunit J
MLAATLVAQNIFFGIIAAAMVVSALRVVTAKNIVHAALYLVVVLIGVAALAVLTLAEFTAATQVLVYVGAIIVLFLFGIMLTQARIGREIDVDNDKRWVAALVALVLGVVMIGSLIDGFSDVDLGIGRNQPQTTEQVSDVIFADYLVAFEAVSVLLLAALIGAIVVARRE